MRRHLRKALDEQHWMEASMRWDMSVENFKRRRALGSTGSVGEMKFFNRILYMRKVRELIFVPKAFGRNR